MRCSYRKEWTQLEVVARIEQINLATGEVTAVNEYSRYGFPTNIIGESSDRTIFRSFFKSLHFEKDVSLDEVSAVVTYSPVRLGTPF